jgi:hypothetical protein
MLIFPTNESRKDLIQEHERSISGSQEVIP